MLKFILFYVKMIIFQYFSEIKIDTPKYNKDNISISIAQIFNKYLLLFCH